jgi:excisionase family DNA binding protein
MEQLIDIKKLSETWSVKGSTIRFWIMKKKIPHVRIGRLVRFSQVELEKWLKRSES